MNIRPPECRSCVLDPQAEGFAQLEGLGSYDVALVGESLGEHEVRDSLPFREHAPAGSILQRAIRFAGLQREGFTIFNSIQCFPGDTIVTSGNIRKIYRRWYEGLIVKVITDRGSLTGTPNHPVFSLGGKIPLQKLEEGSELIYGFSAKTLAGANPNINNEPTTFDELFSSLSDKGSSERTVGSTMDFHGDGFESDVEVITPDGLLRDPLKSALTQTSENRFLMRSQVEWGFLKRLSTTFRGFTNCLWGLASSSYCRMSSFGQFQAAFPTNVLHPLPHHFGPVSGLDPRLVKHVSKPPLSYTKFVGERFDTLPRDVSTAKVLKIEWSWFSSHVYNLETDTGNYTANGILVSNCRPPRNWLDGAPWEEEALAHCKVHRDAAMAKADPKVIVALGNTALKTLTTFGRGKRRTIMSLRGYPVPARDYDALVLPSYHPSFLLPRGSKSKEGAGGMKLLGALIFDLKRAIEIAKDGLKVMNPRFLIDPPVETVMEFERGYDPSKHILSYDIETPKSANIDEDALEKQGDSFHIVRVSLCYCEDEALSVPWQEPYISIVKGMLTSSSPKRVWNKNFDNPRLEANHAPILGRVYDVMWGWHYLQPSLPRALDFVTPFYNWTLGPWKFEGDENPGYYSCCDALALHMNGEGVERDLKKIHAWERYESHVVETSEVLELMSENGLPYSKEKVKEFREELQEKYDERFESIQRDIPDELKPVQPKKGYKRVPEDTTGMRLITVEDIDKKTLEIGTYERWAKVLPFLPTSSQQMKAYCNFKKYKLPKNYKTKKETTDEEALHKLMVRHNDPILRTSIECRQLKKVLGTYVNGWKPGPDGRIHSTPGFWGAMYRISWRNPNISATVADKKEDYIAAGFRKCVEAPEGYVLLERDWSGIEAVLVGWFAEDREYMRLARLGVHSFLLSHMLERPADLSWEDEKLSTYFKELKKENAARYDDAKHCIHGTNYGMGPNLMSERYEMTIATAKRLQKLYFSLFPKVRQWQISVLDRAHKEARLINPYDYRMWFWDVYQWDSRYRKHRLGNEAKSAISFLPRDTAAGMLKEVLLRLKPLAEEGIMIASTHDAIMCQVREDDVDRVDAIVKVEMERPVPELNGLSIKSEAKVGKCWSAEEMEVRA